MEDGGGREEKVQRRGWGGRMGKRGSTYPMSKTRDPAARPPEPRRQLYSEAARSCMKEQSECCRASGFAAVVGQCLACGLVRWTAELQIPIKDGSVGTGNVAGERYGA
ncbi:hypothetical protein C8J57DRAFT_1226421 [Mycena rebaudengoi]|nr:hypothetical protein C8J57DRAFT_1226421 [Mycena rebaudengoi]